MGHKVLIADDSLTIQKVIKITLANEPFETSDCLSESDLFTSIENEKPNIVLLDFNLSEEKTGYDLCRQIKDENSDIKVVMLLGTFDSVEDEKMKSCGADEQIIKPFDGTKFIKLCRKLADSLSSDNESDDQKEIAVADFQSDELPAVIENEETQKPSVDDIFDDSDDEWVMDAPNSVDETEKIVEPSIANEEASQVTLEKEMEDWGVSIPAVIGASSEEGSSELPDVILSEEESQSLDAFEDESFTEEAAQVPKADDLEYPDLNSISETESSEEVAFSALSELAPDVSSEIEDTIEEEGTRTEEEVKFIEDQIADEIDDGDLWKADEVENIPTVDEEKLSEAITQMKASGTTFPGDIDESHTENEKKKEVLDQFNFTITDDMREKIKEQLEPMVETYVKEFCQESIEKVAWEIIPDLAENVIKREIEKISSSIMNP